MARLRVALAQVDPTVGDVHGNLELVAGWAARAGRAGADLVAFPEMVLTGYPVEDLALRGSFVEASRAALVELATRLDDEGWGELPVLVGYLDRSRVNQPRLGRPAGAPHNAAALLHRGRVVARYAKHHLPNYGVFDEFRYFVPGDRLTVARIGGVDVAVAICEDLWQEGGPVAATRDAQAGLLVVINGSPYERNKDDVRAELVRARAAQSGAVLAYVNMVGGQDELVFDGDSLVVAPDGRVLARAPQFAEDLLVVDLDLPDATSDPTELLPGVDRVVLPSSPARAAAPARAGGAGGPVAARLTDEAEVYQAVVTGLRDYVRKNGFRTVILGLSGGIDSALTATVAVDALGADQVYGVSLPSSYSSEHSRTDAAELARRTGLHFRTVPVGPFVDAFQADLTLTGLAEENLQSRIRGVVLMGLSNQEGHLVLTTGNKSELSVGYSTLYGDSAGGFAPLKDVPKTLVYRLARWRNDEAERAGLTPPIPPASITKPPSAELRPGQLDTDSLPDYDTLDEVLDEYVAADRSAAEIVAAGHDPALVERVLRLTDTAEYKRRQYPPGPKISLKAFGRDRRLPITNRWRESTGAHQTADASGPVSSGESQQRAGATARPAPPAGSARTR